MATRGGCPPEESRDPDLKVAGLQLWIDGREFRESEGALEPHWPVVTARCFGSWASVSVCSTLLFIDDIVRFGRECAAMYEGRSTSANLSLIEPYLKVSLALADGLGHILAHVEITADMTTEFHRFTFEIDQSYLPAIIQQCSAIEREFSIR